MDHNPVWVPDYKPGAYFEVSVQYKWYDSPGRDYTVKIYSKESIAILDGDNQENKLYTDGVNMPTELRGNKHHLDDMIEHDSPPPCYRNMSCQYCSDSEHGCRDITTPPGFGPHSYNSNWSEESSSGADEWSGGTSLNGQSEGESQIESEEVPPPRANMFLKYQESLERILPFFNRSLLPPQPRS